MSVFRKKQVEVQAVKFDGSLTSVAEIERLAKDSGRAIVVSGDQTHLLISTLEGEMRADRGDWIIRGVAGEVYPCKPDIFKKTYDPKEEGSAMHPIGDETVVVIYRHKGQSHGSGVVIDRTNPAKTIEEFQDIYAAGMSEVKKILGV